MMDCAFGWLSMSCAACFLLCHCGIWVTFVRPCQVYIPGRIPLPIKLPFHDSMNIALPDELEIALLLQFPEHKRKISAIEQIDFITGFCTPRKHAYVAVFGQPEDLVPIVRINDLPERCLKSPLR